MIERDDESHIGVAVPPSVDQLFSVLQRSITLDRPGLSIDDTITPQEFEWIAQALFSECMDLEEEQITALARAVAHDAHVVPRYTASSVKQVGNFLSDVAALLTLHPSTALDLETREEVLADTHWYHKTIAAAYELMKPEYRAGKANQEFVRRVVGATAIHLEYLESPHFLQEDVKARASNMLIGVAALHGARYISKGQKRRLASRILDAQEVSLRGKPADVLFVPPGW